MAVNFIYPEFEVVRNQDRCIACRVCERQCSNEVHRFSEARGIMLSDEEKCVNCQRCVSLCPTRALKIVKSDCVLRENANWKNSTVKEIYKQAGYTTNVVPVTTEEYGLSKAKRPHNSRLDKSKLTENGFALLPTWQDALSRYLKEIEY